jgi:hypothetical protein
MFFFQSFGPETNAIITLNLPKGKYTLLFSFYGVLRFLNAKAIFNIAQTSQQCLECKRLNILCI